MEPNEKVEIGTVMYFLDYHKITYKRDDLRKGAQNDSVDIYFDRLKLKFQITTEDGSLTKLVSKGNISSGTSADFAIKKFIINPIQRKIDEYQGISTNDIILLIPVIILPPLNWLSAEKDLSLQKELNDLYTKSNFHSIYIIEYINNKAHCVWKNKDKDNIF